MIQVRSAVHAFKWSMLAEIASRAGSAIVLLVLARMLVPEDFGVVAAATVVISISQVFADAGLDKALIQRQLRVDESATVVFWLNLGFGLAVSAILVVAAPSIATFFRDPRIGAVVRVLALQIPLAALAAVQTALLRKELNFKKLFWVRLFTTAAGAALSIPLALQGMGYWSLVAGTLIGQAAQATVLWTTTTWKPGLSLDRVLTRELLSFGKWAMLSGLLGWFYGWADAVVVGHYLGSVDLGLYRTGNTFVSMIFGAVFWPLLPVLYSLFSREQHDIPGLRQALVTVAHAMTLVALPIGGYLFAVAGPVSDIVFGSAWARMDQVIALLALMHGVSWVIGANGEVYRAVGKPHVETWTTTFTLAIYLVAYLVAVKYGLHTFLVVRVSLACAAVVIHVVVARKVLGIALASWLHVGVVGVTALAAGFARLIVSESADPYLAFVLMSVGYVAVIVGGLAFVERAFVGRLIDMVRSRGG